MQKKIVAAICAAALALAMPVAAFAGLSQVEVYGAKNGSTITMTQTKDVDGDLATLSGFSATGAADQVENVNLAATSNSAVAVDGSNVVAAQSFKVNFYNKDGKDTIGLIGLASSMAGTIDFKTKAFTNLGTGVTFDNLYEQIYFTPSNGVNAGNFMLVGAPKKVNVSGTATDITSASAVSSFSTANAQSGTITAVITNGSQIVNPALGGVTPQQMEKDNDPSKSPKTGELL